MKNVIDLLESELLDAEFELEATMQNINYQRSKGVYTDFGNVLQHLRSNVDNFKLALKILRSEKTEA